MERIKNINIPNIDNLPEYEIFQEVITQFMDDNDIKVLSKALPRFIHHHNFIKVQSEAWQEKYYDNERNNRQIISDLRKENEVLKNKTAIVEQLFKAFNPAQIP
jgi:hypothetical protein